MMGQGLAGLDRGQVVHAVPARQQIGVADQLLELRRFQDQAEFGYTFREVSRGDHELRPRAFRHPLC